MYSTVAAVSTPRGRGGIAVIRISGDATADILKKCFFPKGKTSPVSAPRKMIFGEIRDSGSVIDTGLCVYFESGHSFTGEASAEISCHGGVAVTSAVLSAVFAAGAEPAEAGEFTKRAFVNGKLSLTEAEALGTLIDADTDSKRRLASSAARGKLKNATEEIRQSLRHILAALYAAIDYPEEDIGDEGEAHIGEVIEDSLVKLKKLSATYKTGKAVTDGVVTAICGTPNSGKSSLYNLLCRDDCAIVTDIAGTTRDTLWETVDVGGITLRLADTAGIRETGDTVEAIGVDRAKSAMEKAELIIAVFDGSKPLTNEDIALLEDLKTLPQAKIGVINKSDVMTVADTSEIEKICDITVTMSAKTGEGSEKLYKSIEKMYNSEGLSLDNDAVIWESRHKASLDSVISTLTDALSGLRAGDAVDAVCTLAESALEELSLLDGRGVTDEIVAEIFSHFCVGK